MTKLPSELEDSLGFNISRVGLLLRRELMRALEQYKMTAEQWQVMLTVWSADGPLRQQTIAQMTLKDKHTLSRIIHRLERDGWIQKADYPLDGRGKTIQATGKAESLKRDIQQRVRTHFSTFLKSFDEQDRQKLLEMLKNLRGILGDG